MVMDFGIALDVHCRMRGGGSLRPARNNATLSPSR
jgi:hypothetical protein